MNDQNHNNREVDREVPLREPLDEGKLIMEVTSRFSLLGSNETLSAERQMELNAIVKTAIGLGQTIVLALPEGKEREIALNNIESAVLWVKHGLLRNSIKIASVAKL